MTDALQPTLFDYAILDTETRIIVQQRTTEIKSLMKRAAQDIIDIGQKLIEVKERLGYGQFEGWTKAEFDWTRQTAYRFINVAERFSGCNNLLQVAPSALYLLAAPSTPESARAEALERAEAGETITHTKANDIVQRIRDEVAAGNVREMTGSVIIDAITREPENAEQIVSAVARHVTQATEERTVPILLPTIQVLPAPILTTLPADWRANDADELLAVAGPLPLASHQLINASGSNEWYTPHAYTDTARELMGRIDLDPASNETANAWIQATVYYTKETNGLDKAWRGCVWMNPPYGREEGEREGNQARWTKKLIEEYHKGNIDQAVCLVNAATGDQWFAPLWQFPICFPRQRIRFERPDGEKVDAPTHSNVLVYLGPDVTGFVRLFSRFGPVVRQLLEAHGALWVGGQEVG